jgi:hypothetical protein
VRSTFVSLCIATFLLIATQGSAFTVTGSAGAGWQNWTTDSINENGFPYWDGNSADYGSAGNIGNYLTSTGAFTGAGANVGTLPYWGTSTGGFDTSFAFGNPWATQGTATLMLEVAGYSNQNTFGWYTVDAGTINLNQLFSGSASPPATLSFTPGEVFGFYITTPQNYTYFTQSAYNRVTSTGASADTAFQHFALFQQQPNTYWLGIEDLFGGGDRDYNDMVVKLTYVPVPEPRTMILLGIGLLGLGLFGRRRMLKK